MTAGVVIRPALAGDLDEVRALLAEYAREVELPVYQRFDDELAGLPGKYAPPKGLLLVAELDDTLVGCIAYRQLEPGVCEMKRLFVGPTARGLAIGGKLTDRLLAEASAAGYREMKLDSDTDLEVALAVYRRRGFVECERYNKDPMPSTVYLSKRLD